MKKADKQHIEELILEADISGRNNAYGKVFEKLKSLKEKYEGDAEYHFYKGIVAYKNEDDDFYLDWAYESFITALELDPSLISAKLYLGYCYFDMNENNKAIDIFTEIINKHGEKYSGEAIIVIIQLIEYISICHLRLSHHLKFIYYYNIWKQAYFSIYEGADKYFPQKLILEVAHFLKLKSDTLSSDSTRLFKQVSFELIQIISEFDMKKIYKDEIDALKNWDGQTTGDFFKIRV